MWLTSKIKQVILVIKAGTVTKKYPYVDESAPECFRGAPHWDHTLCVGCGGCADHCPARTILIRDLCQEIRVMMYDGARCTYCGRCADLCPEKAIEMTGEFELATDDRNDVTESLELFMLTCSRCGRCYDMENNNVIDRMQLHGYKYDNLETRAFIKSTTDRFEPEELTKSKKHKRPEKIGE